MVVLSWVVWLIGARVVCVVVVVVAGTGFSTTVVQEVINAATARSGVTIISFFIVGVVSFMDRSSQVVLPDVFLAKISKLIDGGSRAPTRDAEKWRRSRDFKHRAAERSTTSVIDAAPQFL
jgi:hypothetical protein